MSEVCVSHLQAGPGEHGGPADSPGARPEERRLSKALLYLSVKTRGLAPTGQGLAGGREGPAGAGGGRPRTPALTAWHLPFVRDACPPPP